MNEKAKQQWKYPIEQFMSKVKCCYNCNRWCEDLCAADKVYAKRFGWNMCPHRDLLTAWDNYCSDYEGSNAVEENLIITLTAEERKTLITEQNEVDE